MKKWSVWLILVVSLVAATACRSRKKDVTQPQAAPSVAEATPQPPVAVEPRDFPPVQPPVDTLSADMDEATRMAHDRGWIRDAFFAFDASTLDGAAQEALRQSATWLLRHPEYDLLIEGHCDERGTEQYNLALGDRRAHRAATYLATLGVESGRIRTVSYGENRPFVEGSNESAWSQNRRAHLVLVKSR